MKLFVLSDIHGMYGSFVQRIDQINKHSEDGKKVRAVHGHSVSVDLGYEGIEPPAVLYHGTATKYQESIEKQGC